MKQRISGKNVYSVAMAFIGYCIGAAFATGQEVLQYFSSHGLLGIAGVAISCVLYIYMCTSFLLAGLDIPSGDGNEVFRYYAGDKVGRLFEAYTILLLYTMLVIMLAGAGAVFAQYYGLDPFWGRLTMAVLVLLSVIFGLHRLVTILAPLGALVIIGCMAVALIGFLKNAGQLQYAQAYVESTDMFKMSESFWFSGILHATLMVVLLAVFNTSLGTTINNKREAYLGGLLGGGAFGVGMLLVVLAELAHIEHVAFSDVPMLYIATQLGIPAIAPFFSIVLLAGIFTTTAPLLWSTCIRFAEDKTPRFRLLALVLSAVGLFASFMPFQKVVNLVFPTVGYVGVVFMAFMIVKQIRLLRESKEPDAERRID